MHTSSRLFRRVVTTLFFAIVISSLAFVTPGTASVRVPRTDARALALSVGAVHDVAKIVQLPFRANLIGVTWHGSRAIVDVRTHAPNGAWSAWDSLSESDNGADPGTREAARSAMIRSTEPHWVGLADAVAVRMHADGLISSIKLSAINTAGNGHPESVWVSVAHKVGAWLTGFSTAQPAQAWTQNPGVKTRAQWGADESWRECCPRYSPTVEVAIVHHTDNPNNYKQGDVPAIIRSIYAYHVKSRGYADIAYNFLIDRYGGIWEGRAGGIDKPVFAAHSLGMNHDTTGVALIGTFVKDTPPPAMMNALVRLLAWKMDVHHIPPSGMVKMTSAGSHSLNKGQQIWMNRIAGHRDVESTDCPGNKLYSMLGWVRTRTMPYGGPKIFADMHDRLLRPDDGSHTSGYIKTWNAPALHWSISFVGASGAVDHSVSGYGKTAEASWDGTDPATGALATTGQGSIVVNAWDASNNHARTVTVPLYIVNKHLGGTVLSDGTRRVVIDEQGASHTIDSDAIFQSWYRPEQVVSTTAAEIDRYSAGGALSFRDGTLVKTSDGTHWWLDAGTRRTFASSAVFSALGYSDSAAITVADSDIASIAQGPQIIDSAVHPDGSVVVDPQSVSWVISAGQRSRIPSLAVRRSWYRDAEVVNATAGDLALPQGADVNFEDGFLAQAPSGAIYVVSNGKHYRFSTWSMFAYLGYNENALVKVSWDDLNGTSDAGVI